MLVPPPFSFRLGIVETDAGRNFFLITDTCSDSTGVQLDVDNCVDGTSNPQIPSHGLCTALFADDPNEINVGTSIGTSTWLPCCTDGFMGSANTAVGETWKVCYELEDNYGLGSGYHFFEKDVGGVYKSTEVAGSGSHEICIHQLNNVGPQCRYPEHGCDAVQECNFVGGSWCRDSNGDGFKTCMQSNMLIGDCEAYCQLKDDCPGFEYRTTPNGANDPTWDCQILVQAGDSCPSGFFVIYDPGQ